MSVGRTPPAPGAGGPVVLWFTGLSGAGKSTLAGVVAARLEAEGVATSVLDGDVVRDGLSRDLGFGPEDRRENVRRVAEVARLMVDAGLVVLVSLISPSAEDRRAARGRIGEGRVCEVFVDATLGVAEARDVKGLYRRARAGEIADFTGIDAPYEAPERPDVHVDTARLSVAEAADAVLAHLRARGVLGG